MKAHLNLLDHDFCLDLHQIVHIHEYMYLLFYQDPWFVADKSKKVLKNTQSRNVKVKRNS